MVVKCIQKGFPQKKYTEIKKNMKTNHSISFFFSFIWCSVQEKLNYKLSKCSGHLFFAMTLFSEVYGQFPIKGTLIQIWKSVNIFVFTYKIIFRRFHIITPFAFWDIRTWDMRNVRLQKQKNKLKITLIFKKNTNFTVK